jgi:MPBQ/MSBQ methyltransferase
MVSFEVLHLCARCTLLLCLYISHDNVFPCRTHPYFISIEKYAEIIDATKLMNKVTTADWVKETIASWRHSIWVGVYDPRGFIFKPTKYLKCLRDAYCLERMHRAFDRGLMQYGMFAATKKSAEELE